MSARLLASLALLLSALPAFAKPPELPFDPTVTCVESSTQVPAAANENNKADVDDPVKDILVTVEESRAGAIIVGFGVNSDVGSTGRLVCHAEGETPIDGLWFAAAVEEHKSCPYGDLLLDLLVPPMRLRHLTPAKVKEVVEELRKHFVTEWPAPMTLPSPRYLMHPPQYIPPTPDFPLPKELARMEEQNAASSASQVPGPCTRDQCPSCPFGAERRPPQEETEDPAEEQCEEEPIQTGAPTPIPAPACEECVPVPLCEECAADEDEWEVQIQIKNLRTGDVIACPKIVMENSKTTDLRIDSDKLKVHASVEVCAWPKAESISVMPHEVEAIEVMPHECEEGTKDEYKPNLEPPSPCRGPRIEPENVLRQRLEEEVKAAETPKTLIGQIIIIGNTFTPESVIREAVDLRPGDELSYPALYDAERRLAELDLFEVDPDRGIHPNVEVLDPDGDSLVKDILISINETPTSASVYGQSEEDEATMDEDEDDEDSEDAIEDEEPPAASNPTGHDSCPAAGCPYSGHCPRPSYAPPPVEAKPEQPVTAPELVPTPADEPCISPPVAYPKNVLNKDKETPQSECPYLKKKQAEEKKAVPVEDTIQGSVDDNIEKLIQARKAMHKAEVCQASGDMEGAARWYIVVKELCPGSRLDAEATEQLEAIVAELAAEKVLQGESEDTDVTVPMGPEEESDACPCECCKAMVKCCKTFFRENWHTPAMELVRTIICCDPHCFFLAKAHVCFPMPKDCAASYPGCETGEGATEETEPMETVPPTQPYDVQLHPSLPDVDPKVVEALERVMKEAGDPLKPKLIIVPEPASDTEESEDPVSQWPLVPPEHEIPSLYLPLETDDLDLYEDETAAAPKAPNAGEILRDVLDAVKQGLYVEVSGVDPETLETKISVHVHGIECELVLGNFGHRYLLVGLLPQATRDLKALQQSLNESVLHWINVSNSGGNQGAEEASEEENEDVIDDEETVEED
jgi:hypothetical protein